MVPRDCGAGRLAVGPVPGQVQDGPLRPPGRRPGAAHRPRQSLGLKLFVLQEPWIKSVPVSDVFSLHEAAKKRSSSLC